MASEGARGCNFHPIPAAANWIPMACAMPELMPESSAYPDESAMVDWVLDQCSTIHLPIITHPPLVDRRVRAQLAKSIPQYSSKESTGAQTKLKRYTSLGLLA